MLSIVVPAYNEARAISGVIAELRAALDQIPLQSEIVVVDDGSTDDTAAVVAALSGVCLVSNPVNLGYGHSIMRGIAAAQGDLIAICDADGSYDPSALAELCVQIQRGVDHAIAQRTGPHFERTWIRRFAYRWLCQYVAGRHVPDANSGLRIFRRSLYENVSADLCRGFSFTTSLTLASLMAGHIVIFSAMPYRARVGTSHVRARDMLRTAQYLFQLVAAYNPVKLFLPLILATALGGLACFGLALSDGIWAAAGAVLLASSVLLLGLAAHAYVVARAAAGPIRGRPVARRVATGCRRQSEGAPDVAPRGETS
jgi:glycosyltransferase involved in cell wall biosynthesis